MKPKSPLALICAISVLVIALSAAPAVLAQAPSLAKPQNNASNPAQAPGQPALPTAAEIEVGLKRTLGYDPKISWQILSIRPTDVPGLTDITVSINKQPALHLYLASDGKNVIAGELIPFGADPYAPARAKLAAADGPARGAEKPSIQIIEFSDLECPHCKAAQPLLDKLLADFPSVRFVFQEFPLPATVHPWAMKAAEYSDCVGKLSPDSFWKFTDGVFDAQGEITVDNADEKLKAVATGSGADGDKIAACAITPDAAARVQKSLALGALLGVNETPTVYINGRKIPAIANIKYEDLKNLVNFEIEHAGK